MNPMGKFINNFELHVHTVSYFLTEQLMVPAIGNKITETLSLNGVTSKNRTIHPPPPLFLFHRKLGCLLFSTGSLNSGTTSHGGCGG